jgi:hypothetical protein
MSFRSRRWSHSIYTPAANTCTPSDEEERIAAKREADKATIAAIEAHPKFGTITARDAEFIASVKEQAGKGRLLSTPQSEWLARIDKRLNAVASEYDPTDAAQVAKRNYTIMHYKATGYYGATVAAMEADSTYMPNADTYSKMWANKFINAGFKRFSAGAKYSAGDMVKAKIYGSKHDALVTGVIWSTNNWCYNLVILAGTYVANYAGRDILLAENVVSIDRAAIAAAKKQAKETEKIAKAAEKARIKAEKDAAKALAAANKPARKPRAKKSA